MRWKGDAGTGVLTYSIIYTFDNAKTIESRVSQHFSVFGDSFLFPLVIHPHFPSHLRSHL